MWHHFHSFIFRCPCLSSMPIAVASAPEATKRAPFMLVWWLYFYIPFNIFVYSSLLHSSCAYRWCALHIEPYCWVCNSYKVTHPGPFFVDILDFFPLYGCCRRIVLMVSFSVVFQYVPSQEEYNPVYPSYSKPIYSRDLAHPYQVRSSVYSSVVYRTNRCCWEVPKVVIVPYLCVLFVRSVVNGLGWGIISVLKWSVA